MQLEFRNVSCGYRPDQPIIRDINMVLGSGEVCCMLGPNGVGKTTLFKTILNLIPPVSGQICIDSQNIAGWKPKRLSNYLAYVSQAHVPSFPYKVDEMAMMGRMGQFGLFGQPSREDYEIVEQALEDVGIRHLRNARYTEISGGERQLLMIARALAQEPKILIMDEPTANLDYGNMITVMKCIRSLAARGICVIFTSHMPDQAFLCKAKVALLMRDHPMIFGECQDVITKNNLYEAYKADIQVLDVVDSDGKSLKIVTPHLCEERGQEI